MSISNRLLKMIVYRIDIFTTRTLTIINAHASTVLCIKPLLQIFLFCADTFIRCLCYIQIQLEEYKSKSFQFSDVSLVQNKL